MSDLDAFGSVSASQSKSISASESDPADFSSWQSDLLRSLDNIKTNGDFSWAQSYNLFVNPGLDVDGSGPVPLPLRPHDAEAIKQACRPAPFGKGSQTVVDDSVRKTWELDHTQFRLDNPHWKAFLDTRILPRASQKLGIVGAQTKPHKLLLYEPGSFFKQHKDSEKEPGMVGTLVICLPSEHEGCAIQLSFKHQRRMYATGPVSKHDMTAMAWFGDVSHEVEELITGYRLVLTYNIIVPTANSPKSASFYYDQIEKLQHILLSGRQTYHDVPHICYPLDHQYSESSLSLGNLKGRDAAVCQVVQLAAPAAGFTIFLANMTHHKEWREQEDGNGSSRTTLNNMYTVRGQLIARDMTVEIDDVLCSKRSYDDDDAADSAEEPEFLGNHEADGEFRYHDTAVIIWSNAKLRLMIDSGYSVLHVDALMSEVARHLKNIQDDGYTVACLTDFMKACCSSRRQMPVSTLAQMLDWSLAFRNDALYESVVKAGHIEPDIQRKLICAIQHDFSKRGNVRDFEAEDWDKWLRAMVKEMQGLTQLQLVLDRFASDLGPCLEPSFQSWKEAVLMTELKTKTLLADGDYDFVFDVLKAHHDDYRWLLSNLLPDLCSRGTWIFRFRILNALFSKREDGPFTLPETTAIYKYMVENSIEACSLDVAEFKNRYSPKTSDFVTLIDQSLCLGLEETVSRILDQSRSRAQVAQLPVMVYHEISCFLEKLLQILQKQSHLETATTTALKLFFETLLRRFFLHTVPGSPKKRFKGWPVPTRECTECCDDCKELNEFLLSEQRTVVRFPRSYSLRRHIQSRVQTYQRCLQMDGRLQHQTEANQVLVVKKIDMVFERALLLYKSQMEPLRRLLQPFKGVYMETLLGGDMYRELVLLESPGPKNDSLGQKRRAEETVDDVKRVKGEGSV
ncbi:hypothetical protein E4U41_000677 [Claviceps citrina]|nr:hypothetical protein E4U41_000677 [Claviceps citrina]